MKDELELDSDINEVFLLHGTKPEFVDKIIHTNFEERIADPQKNLFGTTTPPPVLIMYSHRKEQVSTSPKIRASLISTSPPTKMVTATSSFLG